MTAQARTACLLSLLACLLGGCQAATEPEAHPGQDIRGTYEVSWWITYQLDDTTVVAKAACSGTVEIDQQGARDFSGTATVAPAQDWPCVMAVLPISGTLERHSSPLPYGQDYAWQLQPTVRPAAVFGDCSFLEPSPGQDHGAGQIGPHGELDLIWFTESYDCGGTRYGLSAILHGVRVPS
jgi:hypothetical protein